MGIGPNDGVHLKLFLHHPGKRRVLGRLGAHGDITGIFDREETFGNDVKQISGERDRQRRHAEGESRMTKDRIQRPLVVSEHGGISALQKAQGCSGFGGMSAPAQETAAQHRRQRQ